MGGHEIIDRGEIIDAGGVVEIGPARILVPFAEAHQRLVRPGIVVEYRDLDDPGCRMLRDEIFEIMGLDHHGQRLPGANGPTAIPLPAQGERVH